MWFPYSLPPYWKAESRRDSINESLSDQAERQFLVGFYLHNPVSREWGVELHLAEPQWMRQDVQGRSVSVGYYPNEQERLAEIIFRIHDSHPRRAVQLCYGQVSRLLSHWSAMHGRGFAVGGFRVADLDHDARWCSLPHRPSAQRFTLPDVDDIPETFWPVAAMYRAARNSGNDAYRFLCCYRILELWDNSVPPFGPDGREKYGNSEVLFVSQEMLVLAGLTSRHDLDGIGFAELLKRLAARRASELEALSGGPLPEASEDYDQAQERAAEANLVDLAAHRLLSLQIEDVRRQRGQEEVR